MWTGLVNNVRHEWHVVSFNVTGVWRQVKQRFSSTRGERQGPMTVLRQSYHRFAQTRVDGESFKAMVQSFTGSLSWRRVTSGGPWWNAGKDHDGNAPWQQVPKVNLLERSPAGFNRLAYIRIWLAFLLIVTGVFAWSAQQSYTGSQADEAELHTRLTDVTRSRTTLEADVASIQTRIDNLVAQQGLALASAEALAEIRLDWEAALINLFAIQLPGVTLNSVSTTSAGAVTAVGTATDSLVMQEYQSQLRRLGGVLELVSIDWIVADRSVGNEPERTLVEFTAQLNVQQEGSGA